jgi:hypothetical protein
MNAKNMDSAKLSEIRSKILNGPHNDAELLARYKDIHLSAGVDCKVVYLEDIKSFAVVRIA